MPRQLRKELVEGAKRTAEERMALREAWAGAATEAAEVYEQALEEINEIADEFEKDEIAAFVADEFEGEGLELESTDSEE